MFSAAASSSLLRLYVQPTRNLSAIIMDIFQGFVNDTNTAKLWLLLLNLWGCWLANWKWGFKLSCSCLSAWWSVRSFVNNLLYFDIGIWKYSNLTLFSLFLILINYWFINLWAHLEHKFSGLFLKSLAISISFSICFWCETTLAKLSINFPLLASWTSTLDLSLLRFIVYFR